MQANNQVWRDKSNCQEWTEQGQVAKTKQERERRRDLRWVMFGKGKRLISHSQDRCLGPTMILVE